MPPNPNLINAHLNLVSPGVHEIAIHKARHDVLSASLKALDRLVYRPHSIRGVLRSLVNANIVVDEGEWAAIVVRRKALVEEMAEVAVMLVRLQERMDYLLLSLPAE